MPFPGTGALQVAEFRRTMSAIQSRADVIAAPLLEIGEPTRAGEGRFRATWRQG